MPPRSNSSSDSSDSSSDSYLARAFEESIRLQRHQEHSNRERDLRQRQQEESVLQESRRTFVDRALQEQNEEQEQLRLAIERSAADEQERAARRLRDREERARLDREFGSGGSRSAMRAERQGGQDSSGGARDEPAPAPVAPLPRQREEHRRRTSRSNFTNIHSSPLSPPLESTPPANRSAANGRRRRNTNRAVDDVFQDGFVAREVLDHRENQYRRQYRAQDSTTEADRFQERPSSAAESPARVPRQRRMNHGATQNGSYNENITIFRRNTNPSQSRGLGLEAPGGQMPEIAPPRRTNSDRPGAMPPFQGPDPNSERFHHRYRRHRNPDPTDIGRRGPPPGPSSYDLSEILARSRREAYPTNAPFTEAGLEFNHHELQAAINESAEQGRDPDEEAIERNLDCPTYEEACVMRRYKPRRGDRYVFQGPNAITIEGDEGRNKPDVRMEIVGEMDLAEAMRVANHGRDRNRDQNTPR